MGARDPNAPPQSPVGIVTARLLAELYHDLEDDQRAAETLGMHRESLCQAVQPLAPSERRKAAIRSRWACCGHAWSFSMPATGRPRAIGPGSAQCLDQALATQSYDIEVLIECYQMPDSPADYRAKIRELIEKRFANCGKQIADLGPNQRPRPSPATSLPGWRPTPRAISTKPCGSRNARSTVGEQRLLLRHACPSLFRQGRLCQRREASNPGRRVVAP